MPGPALVLLVIVGAIVLVLATYLVMSSWYRRRYSSQSWMLSRSGGGASGRYRGPVYHFGGKRAIETAPGTFALFAK